MILRDVLSRTRRRLAQGLKHDEFATPDLDASLLAAHAWDLDRAGLFMRLPEEVPEKVLHLIETATLRRLDGEPVAYITGSKEFWGLDFEVGPGVLCPRPDTETLVEAVLETMAIYKKPGRLHDCCTGPGTIALALATERPDWSISASDLSPAAEDYFRRNNRRIADGRVPFVVSDLLSAVSGSLNIIVSNPPYLTPKETSDRVAEGWKEPIMALDGGDDDGLALIRRLVSQAFDHLTDGGIIFLEAHPLQMESMERILADTGMGDIMVYQDLEGRDRVMSGTKA